MLSVLKQIDPAVTQKKIHKTCFGVKAKKKNRTGLKILYFKKKYSN